MAPRFLAWTTAVWAHEERKRAVKLATAEFEPLRCERKLLPANCSLAEVFGLVRRHPAVFRAVYPERIINNIYLDSPGLDDYFDHVGGVARRSKTRIRWYGQSTGLVSAPALERKVKLGLMIHKRIEPLPAVTLNGGLDPRFLEELRLRAALQASSRFDLNRRQPTLVNRYERRYFLSGDGRFRLTVDNRQRFCRPEATGESSAFGPPPGFEIVIELKFAPEHAAGAEGITNAFPFRVARCSKYVLGIERLHPR
jgi:hypothetical protein